MSGQKKVYLVYDEMFYEYRGMCGVFKTRAAARECKRTIVEEHTDPNKKVLEDTEDRWSDGYLLVEVVKEPIHRTFKEWKEAQDANDESRQEHDE